MFKYNIGIDWADDHHDVSIVDSEGKEVKKFRISHDTNGLDELIKQVQAFQVAKAEVAFAIETNQGILVDFLLSQEYTVYPINPKSAERYRDRHKVSAKKDDAFDAFTLADALRTDGIHWKALSQDSPLARTLKILVGDREHLVASKTRVVNQLIRCLKEYYPVALDIFSEIQSPIMLVFLKEYPSALALRKMTQKEFKKFLDSHHYPWNWVKKGIEEFFQEIQASPKLGLPVDEVVVETKSRFMRSLVEQLDTLVREIKKYDNEIKKLMDSHPDNDIFKSLPGAGEKMSAQLAAHFGEDREHFKSYESIQRLAGTSPITQKSGNYQNVQMRWQCQQEMRNVLIRYAFVSLKKCVWARKYYEAKRKGGATHSGALRTLANKWTKIIYTLWQKRVCYQEAIFLASRQQHSLMNAS